METWRKYVSISVKYSWIPFNWISVDFSTILRKMKYLLHEVHGKIKQFNVLPFSMKCDVVSTRDEHTWIKIAVSRDVNNIVWRLLNGTLFFLLFYSTPLHLLVILCLFHFIFLFFNWNRIKSKFILIKVLGNRSSKR